MGAWTKRKIIIRVLLFNSGHLSPAGSSRWAQWCSWRQSREERCTGPRATKATTTVVTDRPTQGQGTTTRGAQVRPAGTRDPAVGAGVSPGEHLAPPAAGTGVPVVPIQGAVAAPWTEAMGTTTWGTGCHQELCGTRVVEVREGLQGGTTGDGTADVLLVVGTKAGDLWENGIIVEVLQEVGIIEEVP